MIAFCKRIAMILTLRYDQSGIEFANGVHAYLQSLGMETRTIAVILALCSIFTETGDLTKRFRRIPTNRNTWRRRTYEFLASRSIVFISGMGHLTGVSRRRGLTLTLPYRCRPDLITNHREAIWCVGCSFAYGECPHTKHRFVLCSSSSCHP